MEGALNHDLLKGRNDGGQDVPPAKHLLANGHEVGDRVVAIANELAWAQYAARVAVGETP